ncbi:unnamed protein product [Gadus morhua 'NCC']
MGAGYTVCCFPHHMQHHRGENHAILRMRKTKAAKTPEPASSDSSDPAKEGVLGSQPSQSPSPDPFQGREPRPDPTASSCSRRESDTELQAFLDLRDQTDSNTEEWEKINYDIHSIRCTRREVCTRWKKILLQLGYQSEVESLLGMISPRDRRQSLPRAEELLQHLRDHSALFPPGGGPQNRYLHVMDCLVSLDSAEDFIRLATEKYPKTEISL